MSTATTLFAVSLVGTVALLGAVIWSGYRSKRTLHLTLVAITVGLLVLTIVAALQVGQEYDLEAAGAITPIHLGIARVATASFLLPAVTGILTLRRPAVRPWHRRAAFVAVGLTVLSAVTGVVMLLRATPLA